MINQGKLPVIENILLDDPASLYRDTKSSFVCSQSPKRHKEVSRREQSSSTTRKFTPISQRLGAIFLFAILAVIWRETMIE